MGKGLGATKGLKKVHSTGKKGAGWANYVLAIATSTLLVGTFLADWYRYMINLLPTGWTIGVSVLAGVVMIFFGAFDVLNDLWPNMTAIYCTLALPTVLSSVDGGFVEWIDNAADWVFGLIDQWLREAVPNGLGIGNDLIAIAFAVFVVMLAQRVNRKGA